MGFRCDVHRPGDYEQPLGVSDRIEISGQHGIVSTIEPVLGERELRLVVQLLRDRSCYPQTAP